MVSSAKVVLESCERDYRYSSAGQLSFFDDIVDENPSEQIIVKLDDFTITEKLAMEKEIAGMYLSGHPMNEYDDISKAIRADKIININNAEDNHKYKDGDRVNVLGVLSNVKIRTTKNNQTMATAIIEDKSGNTEVLVFPQVLSQSGRLIADGSIVKIFGSISVREDENPKILCNEVTAIKQVIENLNKSKVNNKDTKVLQDRSLVSSHQERGYIENIPQKNKPKVLYLRIDNLESEKFLKVKNLLEIFEGNTPVVFSLSDNGKRMRAPRSLWVILNEPMINELRYLLGDENVFIS